MRGEKKGKGDRWIEKRRVLGRKRERGGVNERKGKRESRERGGRRGGGKERRDEREKEESKTANLPLNKRRAPS